MAPREPSAFSDEQEAEGFYEFIAFAAYGVAE